MVRNRKNSKSCKNFKNSIPLGFRAWGIRKWTNFYRFYDQNLRYARVFASSIFFETSNFRLLYLNEGNISNHDFGVIGSGRSSTTILVNIRWDFIGLSRSCWIILQIKGYAKRRFFCYFFQDRLGPVGIFLNLVPYCRTGSVLSKISCDQNVHCVFSKIGDFFEN